MTRTTTRMVPLILAALAAGQVVASPTRADVESLLEAPRAALSVTPPAHAVDVSASASTSACSTGCTGDPSSISISHPSRCARSSRASSGRRAA